MSPTPKGNAQHVANSVKSILRCPVLPSTLSYGRKHEEDAAQPDLSVYGRLWRWLSVAPLLHRQQQQERRWSSAFPLRKILLALFGFHWIPVFGSMAAQNAWVSHPCCRCGIKGSRRVFLLQWRSDETAQCSLRDRRAIAGPELFWFACWPSGVVSISRTIHGKLWKQDHRRAL